VLAAALAWGCCAPSSRPVEPAPSAAPTSVAAPSAAAPADYVETLPDTVVAFDMVWIPEGGFWIGRTEVTWDEYLVYCAFDAPPEGVDAVSRPSKPLDTFPYDREWGTGRRPAVGMSWNAARQYCRWLSERTGRTYRLPTEAEWRLACGGAPAALDAVAWTKENSGGTTHEVGEKAPNAHGLHDVLGNLWEYCAEPYDPAEPEWAVLRGGSFLEPRKDVTPDARLKFDEFWNMADPNVPPGVWWVPDGDDLGFRVLRPGPAKETRR
jgi:formylglycine-generating enzyme required for sulfatase activity